MPRTKQRDPLAHYLVEHPQNPLPRDRRTSPTTVTSLFCDTTGTAIPPGSTTMRRASYWHALLQRWPTLREWVRSSAAWRAPPSWHPALEEAWLEGLRGTHPPLPYDFARDFLPTSREARRDAAVYRRVPIDQLAALSAFAHGWPLLPAEVLLARKGILRLCKLPQAFMWARNADPEGIPLGQKRKGSLLDQYVWLAQLHEDPLAMSGRKWEEVVPEHFSLEHLERLPVLPQWVPRSSRVPTVLP